jgi:hypothetical protein
VPALAGTAPKPASTPVVARGKRLRHKRNTFVNLHQTRRWARVHADVNAAFNMLRKVLKGFAFHAGLTLKYTVLRLSPRRGLTPAQTGETAADHDRSGARRLPSKRLKFKYL